MRKTFIAFSGILLMSYTFSQERKIEFIEYDLPNSLHVILYEDHTVPIINVSVLYHVGSKNEKADRTGFAHFFEHLLFEGSKHIKRGEYGKIVDRNGGTLNANTSQDRTFYYQTLPSNQLELALWLESERMLHAKVENQGIETQRLVVKEEKRQRVDNQPYGSMLPIMCSKVFKKHPYNWVPIGSMDHLDASQEMDYVNFYKTFYVPKNAVLCVAGDISPTRVKELISNYFGTIPEGQALNLYRDFENLSDEKFLSTYQVSKAIFNKNDFFASTSIEAKTLINKYKEIPTIIPSPSIIEDQLTKIERDTIYDNIQLPGIFMGYQLPSQTHPDFAAIELLNAVLSGSASARMNKRIEDEKQQAVNVMSFAMPLEQPGMGIIGAIASQGVPLTAIITSIDQELDLIQRELITNEELEKVLNQYENELVSTNSTIAGIGENLAQNHTYGGSASLINNAFDKYKKVTREDIKRVANQYYSKNARIELYYLPKTRK